MGKRLFGKVLVCMMAVVLCFGFVGVKEVHAATNKVINENTGVSYNTLNEAVTALGSGNVGDSVVLTVDGVVTETADVNINYAGELTIQGGSDGGSIISDEVSDIKSYHEIIISQKSTIKSLKNLEIGKFRIVSNGHIKEIEKCRIEGYIDVVGTIDSINQCISEFQSPVDRPGYDAMSLSDTALIGTITDSTFNDTVWTSGRIETIKNSSFYGCRPHVPGDGAALGIGVQGSGYIGLLKDVNVWCDISGYDNQTNWKIGLAVFSGGIVDTIEGGTYVGNGDDELCSDIYIQYGGRINKIQGASCIGDCSYSIFNESTFPLLLESNLDGMNIPKGYGRYVGDIYDPENTIVYPVSSDGSTYALCDTSRAETYNFPYQYENTYYGEGLARYLFIYVDATPTLSKRLLQNGTTTIPEMTFTFNFEQLSEWNGVQYVSTSAPIADKTVTINSASDILTSDPYVGDLTGKRLYEGKVNNVLENYDPPAVGTYAYRVSEVTTSPIADVTYTKSEFIMLVTVEDDNGTKKVTEVKNILYKDSSGKTKADYATLPRIFDEKQELIFYNTYGSNGGTTPTGIVTNILPFIIIGGAGVGGLTLYVMYNVKRKKKDIS